MKWNNRIEESKFRKAQEFEKAALIRQGMTEEQISSFQELAHKAHLRKRNEVEHGFEIVSFTQADQDDEKYIPDDPNFQYEEDICEDDPFQYGFKYERLNKLVAQANKIDLNILRLLSEGLSQTEVARALNLSHQFVSYRVIRFKKFL